MKSEPILRVLNLGAGVQSSTMALMATAGEITPMPDLAIFADTGWEPKAVYQWLDWLEPRLGFPLRHVSAGNIKNAYTQNAMDGTFIGLPMFTERRGRRGSLRRQCTREFKIHPIERGIRDLFSSGRVPRSEWVEQWYGISIDEVHRMKQPRVSWSRGRWPLVDLRMTRRDCLNWMRSHGYPEPPRSACIGCPYHSDHEWRRMRDNDPEAWADAVQFDRLIRNGVRGTKWPCYLHQSLKPLDEVDLSTPEEHGQLSLFGNECEGMCGV